jgi:hypothetical protein
MSTAAATITPATTPATTPSTTPATTTTTPKKIDAVTRRKYNSTYYLKQKSTASTICACGGKYSLFNYSHHKATKRHMDFVLSQVAPSVPVQAVPVQAVPVQADPVQSDPVQADPVIDL